MASGSSAVRDPLRVAVVGGGVAGLSAAYFVEKYATEAGLRVDTHLLEAQERVGGHIVSEHKDGFLIEGGPDCFLSRKPGGMELVRELGLEGDLVGTESRNRRRLGEEALRKIAEPLVAGVHAGDPDVLSLASTFSRFKEMEDKDRSLILAMLRARRRAGLSTSPVSETYPCLPSPSSGRMCSPSSTHLDLQHELRLQEALQSSATPP